MSENENIENNQEVETIPTDNTTNDLQENVEQSTSDNVANARFKPCKGNA